MSSKISLEAPFVTILAFYWLTASFSGFPHCYAADRIIRRNAGTVRILVHLDTVETRYIGKILFKRCRR
jgi:hypothetical protein